MTTRAPKRQFITVPFEREPNTENFPFSRPQRDLLANDRARVASTEPATQPMAAVQAAASISTLARGMIRETAQIKPVTASHGDTTPIKAINPTFNPAALPLFDDEQTTNPTREEIEEGKKHLPLLFKGLAIGATCSLLMAGIINFAHPMGLSLPSFLNFGGQSHVESLPLRTRENSGHKLKYMQISPSPYVKVAREAAKKAGIDEEYFVRQIQQESSFNPNAQSAVGAVGIAQFMPQTATELHIDPNNPVSALDGAAHHMKDLLQHYHGDYAKALAAYNLGPGGVDTAVSDKGNDWQSEIPDETQQYIKNILGTE